MRTHPATILMLAGITAIASDAYAGPDRAPTMHGMNYEEGATLAGVLDYYLQSESNLHSGSHRVWGDDVHRTTADPMVGLRFKYRSFVPYDDLRISLWIYENNTDNTLLPSTPIWTSEVSHLPTTPSAGETMEFSPFIQFDEPLYAPRDLWIAYRFDLKETTDAGMLVPYRPVDMRGRTEPGFIVDADGDGVPEMPYRDGFDLPGFWFETYSQPLTPAPGASAVLAFGAALLGRRTRADRS